MSVAVAKTFKMKGFRTSITVSSLVVTSDYSLVDFRRSSAFAHPLLSRSTSSLTRALALLSDIKNFKKPQTYVVNARLRKPSESITVLVSCNEIVGVGAYATYHPPEIDPSEYPVPDLRPKKGNEPFPDEKEEDERSRSPKRTAEEMDGVEGQGGEFASSLCPLLRRRLTVGRLPYFGDQRRRRSEESSPRTLISLQ